MSVTFSDAKFDKRKIEITDNKLAKRMRSITPLVSKNGKLYTFDLPSDLRKVSFVWDPENLVEVDKSDYKEIAVTKTQHDCNHHTMFNPSIAEVLAQLPSNEGIVAFYLGDDDITILDQGKGHEVECHWLGKVD